MNKEEIIEKHRTWSKVGSMRTPSTNYYAAMDEYAKQEAIEFAEWLSENYLLSQMTGKYFRPSEIINEVVPYRELAELYQLFINQKTIGK